MLFPMGLDGRLHRGNPDLAITIIKLNFLTRWPGVALGLGLLLPFHGPLFVLWSGKTGGE
jgi:hypothetical protein